MFSTAQENTSHTVVVPYDASKKVDANSDPKNFYLGYEDFQRLWKQAKSFRERGDDEDDEIKNGPQDFVVSSGLYRISATRERLTVEGQLSVTTRGKRWQKVPLKFVGANISAIELDGAAASFADGNLLIEKPGRHAVTVRFELPLDEATQAATWEIPRASANLLEIKMDSTVAEPVLQKNWPMSESIDPDAPERKIFLAALGQQNKIEFRRRLKTAGRGMMTQPNVATIDSHLFVAAGLERLESSYRLEFPGQEENSFTIDFDESITPVRFEIPNLSNWRLLDEKPGLRSLRFELTQPVQGGLTVNMIGERLVGELGERREFPQMAANAARIVQRRSVVRVSDLDVKIEPGGAHRQVPFSAGNVALSGFIPVSTHELAGANEAMGYTLSERDAKRSAVAQYIFQAGRGKLETVGEFQLRSPDNPLLSATISLPEKAVVQKVDGNRIRDWWRTENDLFIRFSGGTPAVTAVLVHVTEELDPAATEMAVAPFELAGFADDEVSGTGIIAANFTQDTVLDFDQARQIVREVGADEVATEFEFRAPLERKRGLRFERGNFSGTVQLSTIPPRFETSWTMLGQAHDSWLKVSVRADVEVTRSAIDRVRFSTAGDVPEFRIVSDEVREVKSNLTEDGARRDYEVVFQQLVTDAIYFDLETEIPHAGSGQLPDLDFENATREGRFIIVENRSADRMTLDTRGVDRTVESLVPYKPDTQISADLFRAASSNWSVAVHVEKLETTAGNEAVVLLAELTTAFRANGEEWGKAVYRLQNRSLQFLPVDMPDGADLISVRVAGIEVRSDKGEVSGKAVSLIPLIQTKPGELSYEVELVYRKRDDTGKGKRVEKFARQLDDPDILGISIEKTLWNLYLPRGHQLGDDVGGNMDRVEETWNEIEKVRSTMAELEALNSFAANPANPVAFRVEAFQNSSMLCSQIEHQLEKLPVNRSKFSKSISRSVSKEEAERNKLVADLNKQKLIITENRIEMPVFKEAGVTVPEKASEKKSQVNWVDNAKGIADRNMDIDRKGKAQIEKIRQQVRLNDSVSIGNKYFNNQEKSNVADPFASPSEVPNQPPTAQPGGTIALEDQVSQVGKLASNSAVSKEVDEKLDRLSHVQIGHGGVASNGAGQVQVIQGETRQGIVQNNFIQLEGQQGQQREMAQNDVSEGLSTYANARSKLVQKGKKGVDMTPQPKSKTEVTTAMPQKPQAPQAAADGFGGGGAVVVPKQNALRATGRRSVAVEFPVEGNAWHFQKLKANAELKFSSKLPSDSKRGTWLLWMLVSIGAVLVGYGALGIWRAKRYAS